MNKEELIKRLQNRTPTVMGYDQFSHYSVLLPLLQQEDEIYVLFEVRSLELRRQPGEICFPGGRVDQEDKNELYTALRETREEIGIQEKNIKNVSPLDYLVSPFGTIIYPFVGFVDDYKDIHPNPAEVAEIFAVPLSHFIKNKSKMYKVHYHIVPEETFPYHHIIGGENYKWQPRTLDEHFYYYEDKVIWGLTARILHHFLQVMQIDYNNSK